MLTIIPFLSFSPRTSWGFGTSKCRWLHLSLHTLTRCSMLALSTPSSRVRRPRPQGWKWDCGILTQVRWCPPAPCSSSWTEKGPGTTAYTDRESGHEFSLLLRTSACGSDTWVGPGEMGVFLRQRFPGLHTHPARCALAHGFEHHLCADGSQTCASNQTFPLSLGANGQPPPGHLSLEILRTLSDTLFLEF